MKNLFFFIFLYGFSVFVNATPQRCILAGDSIQTYVYAPKGVSADQRKLTANLIPKMANIVISNISSNGQRMASSGVPGAGLVSNQNILTYVEGSTRPTCIIIALGTNDWTSTPGTAVGFIQAYRQVVQYSKILGMQVICVLPTWRSNEGTQLLHPDGKFTISNYRSFILGVCSDESVNVFDPTRIGLIPADFVDGLHMSASGHKKFSKALFYKMKYWRVIE